VFESRQSGTSRRMREQGNVATVERVSEPVVSVIPNRRWHGPESSGNLSKNPTGAEKVSDDLSACLRRSVERRAILRNPQRFTSLPCIPARTRNLTRGSHKFGVARMLHTTQAALLKFRHRTRETVESCGRSRFGGGRETAEKSSSVIFRSATGLVRETRLPGGQRSVKPPPLCVASHTKWNRCCNTCRSRQVSSSQWIAVGMCVASLTFFASLLVSRSAF